MAVEKQDTAKPFHVVYVEGEKETFHRGYDREQDARIEMARANKAAQELGIKQGYKVKEGK